MAKAGIRLKIDVTKIEKERLFKGQKGTYLDATVFVDLDEADQYDNNGMITQDVTKEERDAGTKGPILGNCKVFWRDESAPQAPAGPQSPAGPQAPAANPGAPNTGGFSDFDDEIPFAPMHQMMGG